MIESGILHVGGVLNSLVMFRKGSRAKDLQGSQFDPACIVPIVRK